MTALSYWLKLKEAGYGWLDGCVEKGGGEAEMEGKREQPDDDRPPPARSQREAGSTGIDNEEPPRALKRTESYSPEAN